MKLFFTKDIKGELVKSLKNELSRAAGKVKPKVALIYNRDSDESSVYCRSQQKILDEFGIDYVSESFVQTSSRSDLLGLIGRFNSDKSITGININLPLPDGCGAEDVFGAVDPGKDIEGLNPVVVGMLVGGKKVVVPSVVRACYELVVRFAAELRLKSPDVCIINRSPLIGKPLSILLLNDRELNPSVSIIHSRTVDQLKYTQSAQIIVTAAGRPGLLKGEHISHGAAVIDAATAVVGGKVRGDVDVESVSSKASIVTAVPGGVGVYTRYMFVRNILALCSSDL